MFVVVKTILDQTYFASLYFKLNKKITENE